MTKDNTHAGATSRQTDTAALQQQPSSQKSKDDSTTSICDDCNDQQQQLSLSATEKKVLLEPEGEIIHHEESFTQLSPVLDGSSSTLRKRDSSSNLKSMGDDDAVYVPIVFDSDNWSKMMNHKSNESSSHSNTSTTLSESDSGESSGKKSRSSSPERSRTYNKSYSSTSLSSNENTSESSTLPLLTMAAIRKPDTKATLHRSPSAPLLILPSPDSGNDMDPDEFLLQLITALYPNVHLKVKPALTLESYFPTIREDQMAGYNTEIVQITRSNDVTALQEYYKKHGRDSLNCYNRFGEGLLNMACRRGFTEMVQFLLSPDIDLQVRVRDDGGRTPLHDACWYPEPQLDVCTMIIQQDPSLLLVADKRGYTPFQYARKSDWLIWRKFLVQNLDQLRILGSNPDIVARFS
jgi:ankyrin repeat protein